MNLLRKIKGWLTFSNATPKNEYLSLSKKATSNKGLRWRLKRTYIPKADFQIGKWENAILQAKNPDNPNRYELYLLYTWSLLDSHLFSQIRTAHITIQRSAFEIHKNGKLDEQATDLFKRPWFIQYIKHALDAEFWGYSLIEFDPKMENGEFKRIYLLDREHVRPETNEVLLRPYDNKGICYTDKPFNKWLIGVGNPTDLGLLELATREIILKEYSRRDWSIRSEKFGMPFLVIKTSTSDETEIDAKEEMAANFGANGYAILDDQDEFELIEPKNSGGHLIYKDKAEYCDSNISKLINGQTGTSDEKSFVGSAEVHERLLNDYSYSRLRRLQYHVNFELLPFLIVHGYPLQNATFQFTDLMNKTQESSKENIEEKETEKKKLMLDPVEKLYLFYTERKDLFKKVTLTLDLDKLVQETARKIHNKKLKQGDIDASIWLSNVQEIWDGVQNGFGKAFVNLEYGNPAHELMATFRNNIQVFAAFKNHQEISALVRLLKDETGATRSFSDFRAVAEPIINQYNKTYLEAEYNHVVAASQMADKWLEFEENKELFPYLRFRAQSDERVRDSHAKLDGITLELDHEFWDSFFPPIGWGCRCLAEQTDTIDRQPENDELPSFEEVPAVFRNNPARSGELFTEQHPYFEGMDSDIVQRILIQKNQFVYNNFDKKQYQKLFFDKKTGGYVTKHKKHDELLIFNEGTAQELAKQGYGIELLKKKNKAPDAIIDGKVWAFQHLKNNPDILVNIKDGSKRANRVLLVVEASEDLDINQAIAQAVEGTNIKEIGILNGSNLEFIITE